MLESTKMLAAIEKLKTQLGKQKSHIEIARDAVLKQLADINKVEMPPILDEKQRRVFMDKLNHLSGFIDSESGADAIELLVNAFEHYCAEIEAKPVVVEDVAALPDAKEED